MKINTIAIVAAIIGVGLAVIAVARNDSRMAWAAISVLGVTLVTRLIGRRLRERAQDAADFPHDDA